MPQSNLSANRVLDLLPQKPARAALEEAIFRSKAELVAWDEDTLSLEVTPDRLDLLSEGGLGLYLQGALGLRTGPVPMPQPPAPLESPRAVVDASVRPLRPYLAGAVLSAPAGVALDAGLLAEAIRFQELLHATFGWDRRAASLGLYPLERLRTPIRYALEPTANVRFVPLDGPGELAADRFFEEHPLARRYAPLGRSGDRCLTLRDSDQQILSLPPVLNSRTAGEARIGDRELLLESTGTREARVAESVGLLLLPFVARGWSVRPLPVEYPERVDSGVSWISTRPLALSAATLRDVGGRVFGVADIEGWLAQARLGVAATADGWQVDAPPWRPDLQTPVDLAEEVLLARGIDPQEALLPPSSTQGHRSPEGRFRRTVRELLRGLGYVELRTPALVSERYATLLGRGEAIAITNPVSELYSRVRDQLQLSLVGVLERNVRHAYPQRFADVGPVVVLDRTAESGGRTRWHAGAVVAHDGAGFADAAALVDYVAGAFGALGVREPAEFPGTISGRGARLRIAGDRVAEMGEFSPALLSALRVPVPVAWAEIDLTALWPLVSREETP